jgi:hypothetical protein
MMGEVLWDPTKRRLWASQYSILSEPENFFKHTVEQIIEVEEMPVTSSSNISLDQRPPLFFLYISFKDDVTGILLFGVSCMLLCI